MRITLTGRRLALAAVFVLGGAAAPLAYATITGPATTAAAAAAPTFVAPPNASRAPAAVADNPFQYVLTQTISGSDFCLTFTPGQNFVLEQVSVLTTAGTAGAARVSPFIKTTTGNVADAQGYSIPLDSDGDGTRAFSMLIKPNLESNAAVGDLFALTLCLGNANQGSNLTFTFIVTGQKAAGGPTPVAVSDFSARSGKGGATLHWTTASESEILGFNVWRYRGAKGVKVNRTLVRAKRSGEPKGASYRYVDNVRGAKRGLTYRLQLVDLKGKRTWYAAFAIASR